jgi:hypothetical protein
VPVNHDPNDVRQLRSELVNLERAKQTDRSVWHSFRHVRERVVLRRVGVSEPVEAPVDSLQQAS